MTLEEALAVATVDDGPVDDVIKIDTQNKTILLPASEMLFGVEGEKDVERKYFKCTRIVGDNIDLYNHQIYVNYVSAENKNGTFPPDIPSTPYWCDDVALDETGNYITFSWLLSGNVLSHPGFIAFAICAKYVDGEVLKTRWKTTPAIGTVLMTVPDSGQSVVELYPDVITQLLQRMAEVEEIATPEAMQNYVNTWFQENDIIDETLKDNTKAAPAGVVGELKGDLSKVGTDLSTYTGYSEIEYTKNAYINLSGDTADVTNFIPYNDSNVAVIPCGAGDMFTINGSGGNASRLWAFVGSSGNILEKSDALTTGVNLLIEAPVGTAYLVIHDITKTAISYKGVYRNTSDLLEEMSDMNNVYNSDFIPSRNLLNYTKIQIGKMVDNSGNMVDSGTNSGVCLESIKIPFGTRKVVAVYRKSDGTDMIASSGAVIFNFYSDNTFLSKDGGGDVVNIPSNANKILIQTNSSYANRVNYFMVAFADSFIPFVKYEKRLNKYVVSQKTGIKNIILDAIKNNKRIKFLGDSITAGVGGSNYTEPYGDGETIVTKGDITYKINTTGYCFANIFKDYINSKFGNAVVNYGTRGIRTYDIVSWLDNGSYVTADDGLLIVMIGTNNKWATDETTLDDLKNDLQKIIDWCNVNGKDLILISAPVSSVERDTTYQDGSLVKFHNEDIDHVYAEVCENNNIQYISMYQKMLEYCDLRGITVDSILGDGLHPNNDGYYIMYKILMRELGLAYQLPNSSWDNASPT